MSVRPVRPRARAFTLVELLVVIGIIALLISVLMPALTGARRQADRVKCLSALRQAGTAYNLYAIDNQGWWPCTIWRFPENVNNKEIRWHDFIGKYLNGGKPVNADGTGVANQFQDTIGSVKNKNTILWGCPSWNRVLFSATTTGQPTGTITIDSNAYPGYTQNQYVFSPEPVNTSNLRNGHVGWTYHIADGVTTNNGWFYRASDYRQPSERALVYDSIHPLASVVGTKFPTPFYQVPVPGSFVIDFNRHSKKKIGTGPDEKGMNMLFCDGHGEYVSAREAVRAIRFTDP